VKFCQKLKEGHTDSMVSQFQTGDDANNNNNNNTKILCIEIQRMWNMKCFVMPVITGATGIVTKGLKNIWKQYQESIQ
jgi:hypothetical protein